MHSPNLTNSQTLINSTLACSVVQHITDSVTDVVSKSLPGSLTNQISELSQQVHDLRTQNSTACVVSEPKEAPEPPRAYIVAPEPPYQQYIEHYLDDPVLKQTIDFLNDQVEQKKFASENGHSVLSFGEPYTYFGSKGENQPEAIPPVLDSIIQTFSSKLKLDILPNSVLINHYPSSETAHHDSFLPFHSDDEAVIQPDSSIITLSLGSIRSLQFKAIHNATEPTKTLAPGHNSVYTMTRSSQGWYKHGIEPVDAADERFSLTFRCVSQKNKRSVIIQGDSNTKDIKFGSGIGSVGETYPGKRQRAAKIGDICPESCIGYSNVVLVCGTNDLRNGSIRNDSDIRSLVELYRTKIDRIKRLAPTIKIFAVPVLPTRNAQMNKNIARFNSLLDDMLYHCFCDVWHPGMYSFLDRNGLLSLNLVRNNDDIHLGAKGIAQFVRCMKLWIFEREVRERRLNRNSGQVLSQRAGSTEPT